MVSPRDFVLIYHFNKMPNGTIFILAFDAGKPGLVPEDKGAVRASVAFGGWKLEPIGPKKTLCTVIAEIDLKGNIPGWIIKQAFKDQGNQILKLRQMIPKYIADNPHLA